MRTPWERTRDQARRESKTPVLILYAEGKPDGLIAIPQDNITAVSVELAEGREG